MAKPSIEEWFAGEHEERTWPPGPWACAGRFGGNCGVFLGVFDEVQNFIPQSRIPEVISDLERQGEADLARLIEGVRGDVEALRTGGEKLFRDLAGRRFQ
jgi:hypothetical protein